MAKGNAATIEIDGYSFTELEASFWLNWKETGLIMPIPEYRFNPSTKHRFDFAWPFLMLSLECEGGVWNGRMGHTTGSGYIKNLLKYNLAAEQGWVVLRYHEITIEAIQQVARVYRRLDSERGEL